MEGHRNRLCKEYDTEMSPRRRPPPIHGAQMVARVQPLVPEVSLYFPPSTGISTGEPLRDVPRPQPQLAKRQPLAPINSNREGATGGQRPPSPSKCSLLNATADFSISSDTQIFERLEKLITKKEELAVPRPPPAAQSPNASKEVLDLLEWQNGQIRDLQAKLGQLMAAGSGGRRESAVSDDGNLGRPHSQSAASLPQRLSSPEGLQPSASSPTLRTSEDSATQTSVPTSPLLPLKSMPRRREDSKLISMQETVDVPVSPSSPEHSSKHDSSGRSIALGESASFYNGKNDNSDVRGENQDDVSCEEIIAQLQRARRRRPLPEEERRQPEREEPKPRKPLASQEDDLVSGTVARLRQIGVSFISPEEMRASQQPPLSEINTLYQPRLRVDDVGLSTNSSLAINSAALKNLDDRQLTQMARRRPAVEQGDVRQQIAAAKNKPYEMDRGSEESSSLTRYGLPESAMTMGTRQFLMGNRIVDADDEPSDKILASNKNKTGNRKRSENNPFLHDLTQMLQQPKLKP